MFSNSFAGIAPASAPGYIVAQLLGGAVAIGVLRVLYPGVAPEDAADVVLPHANNSIERARDDASPVRLPS
jgi:glycerol uptake facilitator-like aquaporin